MATPAMAALNNSVMDSNMYVLRRTLFVSATDDAPRSVTNCASAIGNLSLESQPKFYGTHI